MTDPITAYPLTWPTGQPRTKRPSDARFSDRRTVAAARDGLMDELGRLGASSIVLSTNLELRRDGLPCSNRRTPNDSGAAVYFRLPEKGVLGGVPHVFACDKWSLIQDNMWAIKLHIGALRGTERWGVGKSNQVFTGYRALPPGRTDAAMTAEEAVAFICEKSGNVFSESLNLVMNNEAAFRDACRFASKSCHPDSAGNHEDFVRLQEAKHVLDEHFGKVKS